MAFNTKTRPYANPAKKHIRTAKVSFLIILSFIITCFAPAGAAPAYDGPGRIKPRDAADFLGDGFRTEGDEARSLKRIIELNVRRADKIPVLLYHHIVKETSAGGGEGGSGRGGNGGGNGNGNRKDNGGGGSESDASGGGNGGGNSEGDVSGGGEGEYRNSGVLSVGAFAEHMRFLYDNKFYTASVAELEAYLYGKAVLPERTVVITFDDGYKSNAIYAYPILKRYKFRAGVFIISRLIGETGEKEFLDWNDMRRCADVFSYHSHTHDMHKLRPDGRTDFTAGDGLSVLDDLRLSANTLDTHYLAYPHGQIGDTSADLLKRAGYRMAFGIREAYAEMGAGRYDIPRFVITPDVAQDRFEAICRGTADIRRDGAADGGDAPGK